MDAPREVRGAEAGQSGTAHAHAMKLCEGPGASGGWAGPEQGRWVLRLFATVLALVGLAASASAQERGSFVVDAMTTPGRHVGIGFYITDGLSLRPSLGFGYSGQYGTTFNLGADLRWEVRTGNRVSPYLTAGFNYLRSPYVVQYDATGSPTGDSNLARYGAGAGLRARIKYGLSAVAEGRVMNSELQNAFGGFSGQQSVHSGAHVEGVLGLSYVFN